MADITKQVQIVPPIETTGHISDHPSSATVTPMRKLHEPPQENGPSFRAILAFKQQKRSRGY